MHCADTRTRGHVPSTPMRPPIQRAPQPARSPAVLFASPQESLNGRGIDGRPCNTTSATDSSKGPGPRHAGVFSDNGGAPRRPSQNMGQRGRAYRARVGRERPLQLDPNLAHWRPTIRSGHRSDFRANIGAQGWELGENSCLRLRCWWGSRLWVSQASLADLGQERWGHRNRLPRQEGSRRHDFSSRSEPWGALRPIPPDFGSTLSGALGREQAPHTATHAGLPMCGCGDRASRDAGTCKRRRAAAPTGRRDWGRAKGRHEVERLDMFSLFSTMAVIESALPQISKIMKFRRHVCANIGVDEAS